MKLPRAANPTYGQIQKKSQPYRKPSITRAFTKEEIARRPSRAILIDGVWTSISVRHAPGSSASLGYICSVCGNITQIESFEYERIRNAKKKTGSRPRCDKCTEACT